MFWVITKSLKVRWVPLVVYLKYSTVESIYKVMLKIPTAIWLFFVKKSIAKNRTEINNTLYKNTGNLYLTKSDSLLKFCIWLNSVINTIKIGKKQ